MFQLLSAILDKLIPHLILNSARTVSMLLNSISASELGYIKHFNSTDNSLYQVNIGIL